MFNLQHYIELENINDISSKILITAKPKHQKNQSVQGANYVFSYHIVIINNSDAVVQLTRRHWYISDGVFGEHEVEGEGVIGQMPTFKPGEKFEYESWCTVSSEYGSMSGYFTFQNLHTKELYYVDVPSFVLLPEFVLN